MTGNLKKAIPADIPQLVVSVSQLGETALKKEVSRRPIRILNILLEIVTFCSGNIFRWFFLQKISTLSENHESGLHHEYLDPENFQISDIFKIWNFDFTYETFLVYTYFFPAEIFMMKPGFVVFRQRRYFLQKISSKNIAGAKSYGLCG